MKRLITTADDFGASRAVNEGIIAAFRRGVLRYASLMVYGEAVDDAVRLAKENPGLGVGLHVELCRADPGAWGMRYFFARSHRTRIEPEIKAQIEKLLAFGLKPTHIDSHFHLHIHPTIFPAMARQAKAYGIPRLRVPAGEVRLAIGFDRRDIVPRLITGGVFAALGGSLRAWGKGVEIPQHCFGLMRSGLMTEEYFLWLIRHLPEGTTEIYFHPSSDQASAVADSPTATHQTVTELNSLLSSRVQEALRAGGINLISEPTGISG